MTGASPLGLLRFPGLTLVEKLRYALHVLRAKSITDWRPYDAFSSTEWLKRWIGPRVYDVMWRTLFHYKFYEKEDSLSAAWLGTRIKRVALSRRSIFQERLGYLRRRLGTLARADRRSHPRARRHDRAERHGGVGRRGRFPRAEPA